MRMSDRTRPRAITPAIRIVVSLTMALCLAVPAVASAASLRRGQSPPDDQLIVPFRPAVLRAAGPFSVCPVDRPRHYRDDFGEPRYTGGFHRHEGIDIFAPFGTPVRAPFAGTVERSSNWAGGLSVRVHGRHGFVYEAHLSSYGMKGRVRAGDVVGYVGNTGDAAGGATHDHFEWHPDGGPAVDPFDALDPVCGAQRPSFAVTLLWE
jgi:murein DD-endopeptidase MepM/ murein hydrolase activator NlpD